MVKPLKGRPITWPGKVTAPPLALELYKLIATLQRSDAFTSCHVYHGANLRGEPMIKFNKSVTSLPFVIASYMGLPYGSQQCDTVGCCNPFHYIPSSAQNHTLTVGREEADRTLDIGMDDWVDLVEYTIDKNMVKKDDVSFEVVRALIPVEDLSDEQLTAALLHMKE